MPIQLINSDKVYELQIDGSIFKYKKITEPESAAIRKKYTKRGEVDDNAVGQEILRRKFVGWKNVLSADGKPAEFTEESIMQLPPTVLADILDAIIKIEEGAPSEKK